METLESHFHNWFGVIFFIILYSVVLLFIPFYRKMDKKPRRTYLAFVIAFAIEMHGIPFSMWLISWVIGRNLPEGILWGHTLISSVGHLGMYLSIALAAIALAIILNGWHNIYKKYWSKEAGKGSLVTTGIYRYIRHPQYTGLLLLSLSMILNWATLSLLILFPVMVFMYLRLAKREEHDMIGEFGVEYQSYMKRTKRFLPFIY
jgi:protein-S-isoprenylcysteine O-methyltransferase Ste14